MLSVLPSSTSLIDRFLALRARAPALRARDAATELGVAEAALVACRCGEGVVRLDATRIGALIEALPELGPVMALTRNDHAVHEKTGSYAKISISAGVGLVLNEAIDLRLFLDHWRHVFVVAEATRSGRRRSLQVFDAAGTAIHKVYELLDADPRPLDALTARFIDQDQSRDFAAGAMRSEAPPLDDTGIDIASFRAAWDALQDTHEFKSLLDRFGVSRTQGLRLAGGERARQVGTDALSRLLHIAAGDGLPIMVFVGNRGCIQIHTGPVANIVVKGPWLNVLDPGFNLHCREDAIAEAWIVAKPTTDGLVTSLELFDRSGQTIALLFGKRKPGENEDSNWRRCLSALETRHAA